MGAAHALMSLGKPGEAAVRLERGRARLLSIALERDRVDLSRLAAVRPDLADRYRLAAHQVRTLESTLEI